MADLMGDNWHNAVLIVSKTINGKSSIKEQYSHGVEDTNPKILNICVNYDYETAVTLSVEKLNPDEIVECPWEISWVVNANEGRLVQSGTFNTSMTFVYAPHDWNMVAASNLIRNSFECAAQIGAISQSCIYSIAVLSKDLAIVEDEKEDEGHGKDAMRTHSTVQMQTYDILSEGWFRANGKGAIWYIIDQSRCTALVVGTMTTGVSMQRVVMSIPDGSYYLRVTGALDRYARDHYWFFCGVYGSAGDELSFFIEDGECLASQHYSSEMLRSGRIRTTLKIHGAMSVSGFSEHVAIDTSVLSQFKSTMEGASAFLPTSNFQITAFSFSKARKLYSEVLAVEFSVSLILENYFIDGTNKYKLSTFAESILSDIHNYVDSGAYFASLHQRAFQNNDEYMMGLKGISLNELGIAEVSYGVSEGSNDQDHSRGNGFLDATATSRSTSRSSDYDPSSGLLSSIVLDYAFAFGFLFVCATFLFVLVGFITFANARRTLDDSDDEDDEDEEEEQFVEEDSIHAHEKIMNLNKSSHSEGDDTDVIVRRTNTTTTPSSTPTSTPLPTPTKTLPVSASRPGSELKSPTGTGTGSLKAVVLPSPITSPPPHRPPTPSKMSSSTRTPSTPERPSRFDIGAVSRTLEFQNANKASSIADKKLDAASPRTIEVVLLPQSPPRAEGSRNNQEGKSKSTHLAIGLPLPFRS
eukprot:gene2631-5159_t